MLKINGFARVNDGARGNTRDLRVLWAVEEMGLPYEIVGLDHPNHDLDSPAYRAVNPFGQIPAIDDDGVVVTESGAILLGGTDQSLLKPCANVRAYRARCMARPAWQRTLDAYFARVVAA